MVNNFNQDVWEFTIKIVNCTFSEFLVHEYGRQISLERNSNIKSKYFNIGQTTNKL